MEGVMSKKYLDNGFEITSVKADLGKGLEKEKMTLEG